MNIWNLPTSVHVAGVDWDIETDYRAIIDVLIALNNPDYDDEEKMLYCLIALIIDFDAMHKRYYREAMKAIAQFIDMEKGDEEKKKSPSLMDWEKDAALIIPAVNKVLGKEIRAEKYMHWWTFMSAYMEMGECSFTHIVRIRDKKARHIKLEKWEKDFIRENKSLVELEKRLSKEEQEWMDKVRELMG